VKLRKAIGLIFLAFLEIVFIAWIIAANAPRRATELAAFSRYQATLTPENKAIWIEEHRKSQQEVNIRRAAGAFLAVGNLVLIGWVARRPH
jgi:hypothetical protein